MWRFLKKVGLTGDDDRIVDWFVRKAKRALIQEQYGAAIRYLDRALEFKPTSNRLHLARGVIYLEGLQNVPEALKCLKQAATFSKHATVDDELARQRARELIRDIMQQNGSSDVGAEDARPPQD